LGLESTHRLKRHKVPQDISQVDKKTRWHIGCRVLSGTERTYVGVRSMYVCYILYLYIHVYLETLTPFLTVILKGIENSIFIDRALA